MKSNAAGVQWSDVWAWAEEIWVEKGMLIRVELRPPSGARGQAYGTVAIVASEQVRGVGFQDRHLAWRALPAPSKARAEDVALQLIAQLDKQLDVMEWERERAALEPGQSTMF